MHEFSIAESICSIAVEEANRHRCPRVTAVECTIGVMRQVVPELLQSAFEAVTKGTSLEGAALQLETEPVSIRCKDCGRTTPSREWAMVCPGCGSDSIEFSGGLELRVDAITAEQEESDEDSGAA